MMKQLLIILLIWPMTVLGLDTPDVLPPYGVWECELKAGVECHWLDHSKLPECEIAHKGVEPSFILNMESSPMLFNKTDSLYYIGSKGDFWTFIVDSFILFSTSSHVILMDPSKRTLSITPFITPTNDYHFMGHGTCTNITPKEPEKPTEGSDKDE